MPETDILSLAFLQRQPRAAARILETFASEPLGDYLTAVPLATLAPVIANMAHWPAARSLSRFHPELAANLLRQLPDSDAETLLRLMSSDQFNLIIRQLPGHIAKRFQRKLAYPSGTVGAWMDTSIPVFTEDTQVRRCLEHLRQNTSPLGGIVVVINHKRKFTGLVEIEKLLTSAADAGLSNLLETDITPLSSRATLWEVESDEGWIRFPTLPVVDLDGHVLGALTHSALRSGSSNSTDHDDLSSYSLITHMMQALFVALGGLMQVVVGISQPQSRLEAAPRDNANKAEQEPRHG